MPLTYLRETKKFVVPELPEAPLIVFINSRSGGRAGPKLAETLFHALGHSQVTSVECTMLIELLSTCLHQIAQQQAIQQAQNYSIRTSAWLACIVVTITQSSHHYNRLKVGISCSPTPAKVLFQCTHKSSMPLPQVYDLNEYRPGPVLQRIYANLTASAQQGDTQADIVRRSALIVAAQYARHISVHDVSTVHMAMGMTVVARLRYGLMWLL